MNSRFPKRNSSGSVLAELSQLRDELRVRLQHPTVATGLRTAAS